MAQYDFDYNIIDVVSALQLNVRKANSNNLYVDCPWCEVNPANGHDGKGKLEVVIAKNYCHCCRCDNGGGMLKLYSHINGCTEKQAHKEMLDYVGKAENKQKVANNRKRIENAVNTAERASKKAPDYVLDKTYRAFLSQLCLYTRHYKELTSKKRSLTPKFIKGFGFKSIPTNGKERQKIMKSLKKNGFQLQGVPGFFINKYGHWDFNAYSGGLFIPIVNLKKQIIGMQFKLDNPKDGKNKYICFSSPYKNKGTSSGSPVHITSTKPTNVVFLTEGALKADIAYCLSGKTFASVQGVNSQKQLKPFFEALKKRGTKRIVDCFDNDCEYNKQVEEARRKLKELVEACGLRYSRMSWNTKYKGIDDYLIAVPKDKWQFNLIDY